MAALGAGARPEENSHLQSQRCPDTVAPSIGRDRGFVRGRRATGSAGPKEKARLERSQVERSVRDRPTARGRGLFVGQDKLHVTGVTYGTFSPRSGTSFPAQERVARDFSAMASCGVNAVRTY